MPLPRLALGAAALALVGGSALALSPETGAPDAKTKTGAAATPLPAAQSPLGEAEIRAALAEEGYALIRMRHEHGRAEAYAMRDDRLYELKIDARNGDILHVEVED